MQTFLFVIQFYNQKQISNISKAWFAISDILFDLTRALNMCHWHDEKFTSRNTILITAHILGVINSQEIFLKICLFWPKMLVGGGPGGAHAIHFWPDLTAANHLPSIQRRKNVKAPQKSKQTICLWWQWNRLSHKSFLQKINSVKSCGKWMNFSY